MTIRSVKINVRGHVQGVGFRYSTQKLAQQRELSGHAKNLNDGSVEIIATGDESDVLALVAWLNDGGPRFAKIDSITVAEMRENINTGRFSTL
ncbi:MAG: Acylphosphatase [Candidatus Erwinia impunctatus]|nr:Acylphosphatase [Culicoides impunctatus]